MVNKTEVMANRNREQRKTYWREFYQRRHSLIPSQFCALVASEIDFPTTVVDWGSGNGRDSLFFAAQGHMTIAMDLSVEAIQIGGEEASLRGLDDKVLFLQGDLSSYPDIKNTIEIARKKNKNAPLVHYSRFVLHTLDDSEEDKFLLALSECMKQDEYIFFEFRAKEDINRHKHHPDHFRRYIDATVFQRKLEDGCGFFLDYSVTGVGMAKYKEEDPVVTRVFARKA